MIVFLPSYIKRFFIKWSPRCMPLPPVKYFEFITWRYGSVQFWDICPHLFLLYHKILDIFTSTTITSTWCLSCLPLFLSYANITEFHQVASTSMIIVDLSMTSPIIGHVYIMTNQHFVSAYQSRWIFITPQICWIRDNFQ